MKLYICQNRRKIKGVGLIVLPVALVALGFIAACVPYTRGTGVPTVANATKWDIGNQCSRLGQCMNLGNALDAPVEGAWGVKLKDTYFSHIKSLGFQSVRIPVRWSTHVDSVAPYTIDETFFKRVQWAIDQALSNHLRAIINVHHFDGLMGNPRKYSPVFLSLWEQVSKRFASYGPELYLELCNEPNGELTPAVWNDLARKALSVIRQTNPSRSVIIGSVDWNGAAGLPKLVVPQDGFLIATFHTYEPHTFTHQGASWVKGSDLWKGSRWRASRCDTAVAITRFNKVGAWAAKNQVPVFLGEFGAFDRADTLSRILYTSFVAKQARARGWSYAYWKYNTDFGIYDDSTGVTRDYLVNALLKPESTFAAWRERAIRDTLVTPDPGSGAFAVLDDFDDGLPGRGSGAAHEKCCFWSVGYGDSCSLTDARGGRIPQGADGFGKLVGAWGKTGNGLHAKEYIKGSGYPGLRLTACFPGVYNKDWFDFSQLTALSFYAKGFGSMSVELITDTIQNGYPKSDNWGHFACNFELTDTWKYYVIPVGDLRPKPFSKPQQDMLGWSAGMKKACAVVLSSSPNYGPTPDDSLEIFLDDIRLHGVTKDTFKRPSAPSKIE